MHEEILDLSIKLIKIPSIKDDFKQLDAVIEAALEPIKKYEIERFERNGIRSVLVHNKIGRPDSFRVLLNGHLDVVPANHPRFYEPKLESGRLYGVGSMDMKANTAAMIYAFKTVAAEVDYPLGIQLVTDEETGGFHGTKLQVEQGVKSDFVIVGEATNLNIENQMKGIVWAKAIARGKTAHGAYPWAGDNAIARMNGFINNLLERFPAPKKQEWVSTITMSNILTNNDAQNKIPNYCELWLDVRYVPEDTDSIVPDLQSLVIDGVELEIIEKEPAHTTNQDHPDIRHIQRLTKTIAKHESQIIKANGGSDVRHFEPAGSPGVEFGPPGGEIGSDTEWVEIAGLKSYYDILVRYLREIS